MSCVTSQRIKNAILARQRRGSNRGAISARFVAGCFTGIPPLLAVHATFSRASALRLCHLTGDVRSSSRQNPVLLTPPDYPAVHPPSTISDEPVIRADASLARKTTAPMRSSTALGRPSLIRERTSALNSAFSKNDLVIGISMNVGHSVLTRMPCGASSIAIARVNPSIAHWLVQ